MTNQSLPGLPTICKDSLCAESDGSFCPHALQLHGAPVWAVAVALEDLCFLERLRHPNIAQVVGIVKNSLHFGCSAQLHVIVERHRRGTLRTVRSLPPEVSLSVLIGLCAAVDFLASENFQVSVNPDNIWLNESWRAILGLQAISTRVGSRQKKVLIGGQGFSKGESSLPDDLSTNPSLPVTPSTADNDSHSSADDAMPGILKILRGLIKISSAQDWLKAAILSASKERNFQVFYRSLRLIQKAIAGGSDEAIAGFMTGD